VCDALYRFLIPYLDGSLGGVYEQNFLGKIHDNRIETNVSKTGRGELIDSHMSVTYIINQNFRNDQVMCLSLENYIDVFKFWELQFNDRHNSQREWFTPLIKEILHENI